MTVRLSTLMLLLIFVAACSAPSDDGAGDEAPAAPAARGGYPAGTDADEDLPFVKQEGQISWDVPESWESQPPSNPMRKAQYVVPAAAGDADNGECVVFYFGAGQGGPPRMNAERWAGQFKDADGNPPTPEITESNEGGRAVMNVTVEGTYAPSPMMAGPPQPPKTGYKLLGAIVAGPDASWFFKCTGPVATINASRDSFDDMIASVR